MVKREALRPEIRKAVDDHLELYRTDPDKAHYFDLSALGQGGTATALMLKAKGRTSGEDRYCVLQYYKDSDTILVVGSYAGSPEHPSWYLNLLANPGCEIQTGRTRSVARARMIEGPDHDRLWEKVCVEQPQYLKYRKRTDRIFPIIAFEIISSTEVGAG